MEVSWPCSAVPVVFTYSFGQSVSAPHDASSPLSPILLYTSQAKSSLMALQAAEAPQSKNIIKFLISVQGLSALLAQFKNYKCSPFQCSPSPTRNPLLGSR